MTSPITAASAVTSVDGTLIAIDRTGPDGVPALVVVDGVLAHRPPATLAIARSLAVPEPAGGTATPVATVRYDRRGRGNSGFTPPYAVEREVEDLSAVLDAHGPATLLGLSTGAFLALRAAAELGREVAAVVVHTPRHDVATGSPYAWRHLVAAVESCVAEGDPGSAVELFLDVAGIPPGYIAGLRDCPNWTDLERHAATIAHDGRLATEMPSALRAVPPRISQPLTVVTGDGPASILAAVRRTVAGLDQSGSTQDISA